MNGNKVRSLTVLLDQLARRTWERVHLGPASNMPFREDGLTDENLFILRSRHPWLYCYKFKSGEEASIGADWEWWIGSDDEGWVGLRIQAKKLTGNLYREVAYQSRRQDRIQCQVLIDECESDSVGKAIYPLYCFYNGWDRALGWPSDADWTINCKRKPECPTVPDLTIFGCALADAHQVLECLRSSAKPHALGTLLPLQRPWSWMFRSKFTHARDVVGLQDSLELLNLSAMERRPVVAELPVYANLLRFGDLTFTSEGALEAPAKRLLVADLGFER
jgi:hypothetical protein